MAYFTLIQDTVQVLRAPTTVDAYNSLVRDWDNATVAATGLASVQHSFSTENVDDRQTTTTTLRLISADVNLFGIRATDRIVWQGQTFDVDSEVMLWRWYGADHHIELFLREVSG